MRPETHPKRTSCYREASQIRHWVVQQVGSVNPDLTVPHRQSQPQIQELPLFRGSAAAMLEHRLKAYPGGQCHARPDHDAAGQRPK